MKLNKFLSFTATVLLLAGVVGCGNNPAPEVNPNIGKRFTENGYTLYFDPLMHGEGVTIEKYEGTDHFPTIPTTFKDAPVVELADEAFKGNKDVYAVNIPTSIIALGEYVFSECTNLVSVYMPSSILFAQDYIFSKSSRVSVYLEDSQSKVAEKIEAYDKRSFFQTKYIEDMHQEINTNLSFDNISMITYDDKIQAELNKCSFILKINIIENKSNNISLTFNPIYINAFRKYCSNYASNCIVKGFEI